jgi:hypothetical protein
MNQPTPAGATHLTILVPDETVKTVEPARPTDSELRPGEVVEDALVPAFIRKRLIKDVRVPLDKIEAQIRKAEQEVAAILASLQTATQSGYQLKEVHVLVGISGRGSVGVVSAGGRSKPHTCLFAALNTD